MCALVEACEHSCVHIAKLRDSQRQWRRWRERRCRHRFRNWSEPVSALIEACELSCVHIAKLRDSQRH